MRAIPNKLFFKISEVAEIAEVETYVLRFWQTEFPELAPEKSKAGHRVYRKKDVEMVLRIRELLYDRGFTIAGARKQLDHGGRGPVATAAEPPPAAPPSSEPASETASIRARTLARMRDELREILTLLDRKPRVTGSDEL